MIPIRSRRPLHGFSLIEMLIVISIIGIAMAVEMRVFRGSLQAIRTSNDAEFRINNLGRMSSVLRQDVWGAASVEMPDSATLVLRRSDGATIRWRLSDVEVVRVTGPAETPIQQRWKLSAPLQVRSEGAAVVLYAAPDRDNPGAEMRFLSQVILARESR